MTQEGDVPALRVDRLVKCYGTFRAVDDLSLHVRPGEIYGLLGPNGAGKTTTLRVILGFLSPDGGTAAVFGIDTAREGVRARTSIGYLPGDFRFEPFHRGGEVLDFLGRCRGGADRAYRDRLVARLRLDLSKRVRDYSKGNRQKLGIIAALQHRPRLAILDEPTGGLDPLMQREFIGILSELAESGSAILFSSHVLSEVEHLCTRVGVLRQGKLVFERTFEELTRDALRRVEVAFADPPAETELAALPGVKNVERHGRRFRLLFNGDPDRLVKTLAQHAVHDIVFERPNLEDLFMELYEKP